MVILQNYEYFRIEGCEERPVFLLRRIVALLRVGVHSPRLYVRGAGDPEGLFH